MISSQEIRLLVTALGTGIGKEDRDLSKLRYHTIIIMTDADVDGSHIRTLLLTLFYRQLQELIEQGHVFIAQPPLYKVKKGKAERYLKDDTGLEDYLIELGTEDVTVQAQNELAGLTGVPLQTVVKKVRRLERILDIVAGRHKNRDVVAALVRDERMGRDALFDKEILEQLVRDATARLKRSAPELEPLTMLIVEDPEHACFQIHASTRMNGSSQQTVIDMPFCLTPEFEELRRVAHDLRALGDPPFTVIAGDQQTQTYTLRDAVAHIIAQARKGLDIQRYKGLGEMNPEQLWETTMNPETRTLLQVKIEDAYEADDIFSTLMGDEVEPRRKFIEDNALNVKNLDI